PLSIEGSRLVCTVYGAHGGSPQYAIYSRGLFSRRSRIRALGYSLEPIFVRPPPKGRVADLAVRRRLANCQQRPCAALLPDRAQRYVIAVAQPITDLRVFDNDMVPLDGPCAEAGRAPAPLGLSRHADVILGNDLGFAHVLQDQHDALVVGVARRFPAAGKLGW